MDYNIQVLSKSTNVLELVSMAQCTEVALIDAPKMVFSYNSKKDDRQKSNVNSDQRMYVEENKLAYYTIINTWGRQILDVTTEGWASVYQRVMLKGLIPIVRECNDLSDILIHGESYDRAYTYGYLTPLIEACSTDFCRLLQLLRYPKRFSPVKATAVSIGSLQAFINLNSRIKAENVRIQNLWYLLPLRAIVADMLRGFEMRLEDGYFSNGVAADAKRPLLAKLRMYRKYNVNLSGCPLYPIAKTSTDVVSWRGSLKKRGFVKIVAVPKSYKAARIIAEEPASTQFNLQAIAKGMIRAIQQNGYSHIVDVRDQTRNQRLAMVGSQDGSYATIDFSSASDSISEALAVDLLPASVSQACLANKQAYLEYTDSWSAPTSRKTQRVTQMWSTSGSAITFPSESIIIAAMAIFSTETVSDLLGESLNDPSVFGDDVVIDDRAAEFFIDLVTRIGMTVNKGKSFYGQSPCGWYRESCGVEYLNGIPMHSRYYPRRPVLPTDVGLTSLIDLEKRMFDDWSCRLFIRQTILSLKPKMTSSLKGEASSDLWDTIDDTDVVYLRDGDGNSIEVPYAERHKHLVLVSDYKPSVLSESDIELLDMWYYHAYLLAGPLYSDPLDRTLGVSTSRKNYDRDSQEPGLVWRYKLV